MPRIDGRDEYFQEYYRINRDDILKKQSAYDKANREKRLKQKRDWYHRQKNKRSPDTPQLPS